MQDISNLKGIFGDVQALQGKLKSRVAELEQSADKFKTALQTASKSDSGTDIVTALKQKVAEVSKGTAQTSSGLADQIQATLTSLQQQLQALQASSVSATSASTNAAAASTSSASSADTQVASVSGAAAASATTVAAVNTTTAASTAATTTAVTAAAAPPAAAPATTIAAVNPTHPPYRVYDPSNPSAFVMPNNPGGGPNLLASDLVFNTDPRPDSLNSLKGPTAAYGTAEWNEQIKTSQAAYEKLSNDNAAWNQKNMEMRNQILLASPYAAFAPSRQGTLPGMQIS